VFDIFCKSEKLNEFFISSGKVYFSSSIAARLMKMAENKTCDSCRRCSGVLLNTFISLTSTFGFKNLCFQGFESKFCRNPNINSKDMTNLNK